jgi:hypothetical protein
VRVALSFALSFSGNMNFLSWNSCSSSISMRCARAPWRVLFQMLPLRHVSCLVSGNTEDKQSSRHLVSQNQRDKQHMQARYLSRSSLQPMNVACRMCTK